MRVARALSGTQMAVPFPWQSNSSAARRVLSAAAPTSPLLSFLPSFLSHLFCEMVFIAEVLKREAGER